MAKKLEMTKEIKEKLKRSIPSLMEPREIIIESDDEPDHVFKVKLLTNLQFMKMVNALQNTSEGLSQTTTLIEVAIEYITPNITSWKYDDEDYTDCKEDYIQYVKPTIIIGLFNKLQELYQ